MEEYTLSNEPLAAHAPLTTPHFDDEATLVSARPVVPLEQVKDQARSKRRLGFGLAIAGAVVAGALGASVIYKQRDEPQQSVSSGVVNLPAQTEPADSSNSFVSAAGNASGSAIDSNQHPSAAAPASAPIDAKSVPTPTATRTQTPRVDRRKTDEQVKTSTVAQYDEDQILQDEIDQRREERREERRLWRERRNRRDRSSDGVNHIREIFEGRPRP